MSYEKESVEGDEIHKNDNVTLADVYEESQEIDKINRKEQDGLELDKSETNERDQIEISGLLKNIDSQKRGDDDDLVDTDIDRETNVEESEEKFIQKKAKKMIQNQKNQKLMKEIREKIRNYFKAQISKRGDDDDLADTDIDREK